MDALLASHAVRDKVCSHTETWELLAARLARCAAEHRHGTLLERLARLGAPTTSLNEALYLWVRSHWAREEEASAVRVVGSLLGAGADPEIEQHGENLVEAAVSGRCCAVVGRLLEEGCHGGAAVCETVRQMRALSLSPEHGEVGHRGCTVAIYI